MLVRERESERTPGQLTGYAVALRPSAGAGAGATAEGRPVFYGGGKLAPDLTLPQLQARWAGHDDDVSRGYDGTATGVASAAATGSTGSTAAPAVSAGGRVELSDVERRQLWTRAENDVRHATATVNAALREGASAHQLAEATDAAWAANDYLAATARLVEGRGGAGPLAGAARHYDRAARQPGGRPPVAGRAGTRLRQGAALLALAGAAGRHETTSLLGLLTQLQRLADRVQVLREAQGRAWQARGARLAAEGLQHAVSHYGSRLPNPASATGSAAAISTPLRSSPTPPQATAREATPQPGGDIGSDSDQEQSAARRAQAGFPSRLTGLPARPVPDPRARTGPRQGGTEPPHTTRGAQR